MAAQTSFAESRLRLLALAEQMEANHNGETGSKPRPRLWT
jgi:hypothetical protein